MDTRLLVGHRPPEATLTSGSVRSVIAAEDLLQLRQQMAVMTLREELVAYGVDIVRASRSHESVLVGAGPRATQSLLLASRASAVLAGRDFVTPDDIKSIAPAVLEHRLILRPEFVIEGVTILEVIQKILEEIAVPR